MGMSDMTGLRVQCPPPQLMLGPCSLLVCSGARDGEGDFRGTDYGRGAFSRGPELCGAQHISPREFMRRHQREPPGLCLWGPGF